MFLLACHCWLAQQCTAEEPSFKELLQQALPGMGAQEIADRKEPQQKFQAACYALGAPGREAQRADSCKLIAGHLGPQTAKPARLWLLKQLEFIGQGECVAAIAAQLDDKDPEISDAARRALENNPAPEANAALLKALEAATAATGGLPTSASASRRIALINSLGERRDSANAVALEKLLDDRDDAVAIAAANALGKTASWVAFSALQRASEKSTGRLRSPFFTAYVGLVDKLTTELVNAVLRRLQKSGVSAEHPAFEFGHFYQAIAQPDCTRPIRLAAKHGILRGAGGEVPILLTWLASEDADTRAIAAGYVNEIKGPEATKLFAAEWSKLPPSGQVLLLGALAARGDKAAVPAAVAAAQSENQQVRIAAIESLAKLGDASVILLLIDALAAGGDAGSAAKESLQQVYGKGVDEAIVAAMKKADPPLRDTLLDVLQQRGDIAAVPALLEFAEGPDTKLRDRAMRALGKLAGPENVPAMIKTLLGTEKGAARDEAEKAIMFACNRGDDEEHQAAPVLAALAESKDAQRVILLPLLGRIGGPKALAAVQAAMESPSPEIREAGIRALCNWPDAGVADQLLALAQRDDSAAHRTSALRAYIRVIALDAKRSPKQSLKMFKKAMELIARDDERKLLLTRVSEVRDVAALRFAVPYLDNPALATEASRAVVDLSRRRELFEPHRAEFTAALKKVTETCKDERVVEQAKRIMTGL